GAGKVRWRVLQRFRSLGHGSWLAVGKKQSKDAGIFALNEGQSWPVKVYGRLYRKIRKQLGHQIYFSPGSWRILEKCPQSPDVLHAHNLHGLKGYFDLRALPALSRRIPTVLTLHDASLLSGHSVHSCQCDRWESGW